MESQLALSHVKRFESAEEQLAHICDVMERRQAYALVRVSAMYPLQYETCRQRKKCMAVCRM